MNGNPSIKSTLNSNEIQDLMDKISELIPVSDALVELIKLRAVSTGFPLEPNHKSRSLPNFKARATHEITYEPLLELASSLKSNSLEEYGKQLNALWSDSEDGNTRQTRQLLDIKSNVNLVRQRLSSLFNHSVLPISIRGKVVQILVSKIGHPELIKEAESNSEIISQLLNSINQLLQEKEEDSSLTLPKTNTTSLLALDILDNRATALIGAMTAIETRRLRIEELVREDQKRHRNTVFGVSVYIVIIAICLIVLPLLKTIFPSLPVSTINLSEEPLTQATVSFWGIPTPILIWSFIGSFAAMIHRFNSQSVYYFNDAIKWMLTRHVQGIVLSSAFYLVLTSGLFLITNGAASQASTPQPSIKDELVLVLSFLIGFSDRFVDSVFNTLIERYTGTAKPSEKIPLKEPGSLT
ncbi:hypothetical protein C7B65_03185 [Phormidesmis priestleyi ULC007]|uniref:Uncharacterized protein n=1 Tax=Phormidesmis priestleyi ULC007 TaxID=1920490 RepID=A0A2T1DMB1_9CYAN|nr:hypothetical protein [Phormidesmis priestleyi]PSB21602.1 hypothetical protein C7B65_03185 [Phormidesmis priestleyi ULC007]PZO54643.1 MAG: hypothetical protein DCF14_01705 [Phormidesmis priestleyi]